MTTNFGNAQGGGIWVGNGGPVLTRVRLNDNGLDSPYNSSGGGASLNNATVTRAVVDNNGVSVGAANQEYDGAGAYGGGFTGTSTASR